MVSDEINTAYPDCILEDLLPYLKDNPTGKAWYSYWYASKGQK